ncbi:MAG TPA: hypothetical protein VN915_13825 [Elusimicrobiota bacterium]|nr:hypothetical protein [Elusimicrobiota bacterium]
MSDENTSSGLAGVLTIAVLLAAAALGGWYFLSQRGASTVDSGGFDVGAAATSRPPAPAAAPEAPARSGLDMMRVDEELRAAPPRSEQKAAAEAPAPVRALKDARLDFIMEARRNEDLVRRYAERMTARSPVILQYGKDWMSHPDLKKLNDDYMRDHDPIAFLAGLSQAPSFPILLKQYAGKQEILGFIVQGLTKEAPRSLVTSGLALMREDASLKPVITEVETAAGMTPAMADQLTGGSKQLPAK